MIDFMNGIANRIHDHQAKIRPRLPHLFERKISRQAARLSQPDASVGSRLWPRPEPVETTQVIQEETRSIVPEAGSQDSADASTGSANRGTLRAGGDQIGALNIQPPASRLSRVSDSGFFATSADSQTEPASDGVNASSILPPDAFKAALEPVEIRPSSEPSIRSIQMGEEGQLVSSVRPITPTLPAALPSQVVDRVRRSAPEPQNQVVVRIGRLEVRAVKPPSKPQPRKKDDGIQPMGLEEYARRRSKDNAR